MPIITGNNMARITTINGGNLHTKAAAAALEQVTTEMAKGSAKTYDLSPLFASNHEEVNEAFISLAKIHGYAVNQEGTKFFLIIPEKN